MATDIRNGNGSGHDKLGDSAANKADLKMDAADFWRLSFLQKSKELSDTQIIVANKDAELSLLRRRIHELENFINLKTVETLKIKSKTSELELVQFRTNLAEKLQVKSLDEYIIDTETFVLKHEGNI